MMFFLLLPVWLGGCLSTLQVGGSADPSSPYRSWGSEYGRGDELPTPQFIDIHIGAEPAQ